MQKKIFSNNQFVNRRKARVISGFFYALNFCFPISNSKNNLPFLSTFNILYNIRKQSKVIFRTNTIYIDKFGINTSPELIQFGGEMGKKRLGDLLPFDYSIDI